MCDCIGVDTSGRQSARLRRKGRGVCIAHTQTRGLERRAEMAADVHTFACAGYLAARCRNARGMLPIIPIHSQRDNLLAMGAALCARCSVSIRTHRGIRHREINCLSIVAAPAEVRRSVFAASQRPAPPDMWPSACDPRLRARHLGALARPQSVTRPQSGWIERRAARSDHGQCVLMPIWA